MLCVMRSGVRVPMSVLFAQHGLEDSRVGGDARRDARRVSGRT